MKAITNENAWKRTSQLIEDKFGKKIEFNYLTGVEDSEDKGDDLLVPLKHKTETVGTVVIRHGATLTVQQKQEATDLIQFLITPQAYSHFLQLKIERQNHSHKTEGNVIQLFNQKVIVAEDKRQVLSQFIHIKSQSRIVRHKVAMKLHEMAGTIVLLRLQDIFKVDEEINMEMDLTDTALFIEDLSDLTAQQWQLLEKLAAGSKAENSLILVGSDFNETSIKALKCNDNLKNDLIGMMFDADRIPANQQTNEEVLELLFFHTNDSYNS